MAVGKAKILLQSLRWYHLGFAFVWAITFSGLASQGDSQQAYRLFSLSDQAFAIAAVVVAVFYERHHTLFPRSFALIVGVLLAIGALLHYLAFNSYINESVGALSSGVCIGLALGLSYVLWQQFFASEGASRTAIYIPLSALLSLVLSALLSMVPDVARAVCSIAILPLAAAVSLRFCLGEIVAADPAPRMIQGDVKIMLRSLWKPVFCACSIGFVWKLVSHLFSLPSSGSSFPVLAGMALAVAVVALIELFSEKGFPVLRVYQVLFPVITGAFLLPTLLGPQFAPLLNGILFTGFEILNLLLIVTCAVYASERSVPSTYVYALCVGPTLLSMLAGDVVGTELSPLVAYDFTLVINILFVCIYGLSLVLFFIAFTRKNKQNKSNFSDAHIDVAVVGAAPSKEEDSEKSADVPPVKEVSDMTQLIDRYLNELQLAEPFSKREREVVGLVLRGNNVPAIARKLYISENTARDHMKSIYRKADVHSRQELIDLFD